MKPKDIIEKPFCKFDKEWALVTAGTKQKFNTMTVSWGMMGTLWSKPVVLVFIKPCRYTSEFMLNSDYFTVSFYDEEYHHDLAILGSNSGRDGDKIAKTKLEPVFLEKGITFKQAKCTYVLKKIYTDQFKKDNLLFLH